MHWQRGKYACLLAHLCLASLGPLSSSAAPFPVHSYELAPSSQRFSEHNADPRVTPLTPIDAVLPSSSTSEAKVDPEDDQAAPSLTSSGDSGFRPSTIWPSMRSLRASRRGKQWYGPANGKFEKNNKLIDRKRLLGIRLGEPLPAFAHRRTMEEVKSDPKLLDWYELQKQVKAGVITELDFPDDFLPRDYRSYLQAASTSTLPIPRRNKGHRSRGSSWFRDVLSGRAMEAVTTGSEPPTHENEGLLDLTLWHKDHVEGTIPTPFEDIPTALGSLILGQECYTTLIYNVDPSVVCLKLAISKALGIGIIIFGSILKIPQIYKIVRSSSARGISLSMYSLEVVAYDISLAYAFRKRLPFSTYGENASLTIQNMLITLLIIYYDPKAKQQGGLLTSAGSSMRLRFGMSNPMRPVLLAAAAMIVSSVFLFLLCPPKFLSVLQAFSIPISLVSKLPQILELNRNKEPGQLSAIVVFGQLMGTIARVYTTVVETGDWLIGIGFGLASVLNAVIAMQYIYYWNGKNNNASLPLSVSSSDRKKSDGDTGEVGRERMRHATINLSIDTTGNGHAYPLGASTRSVSEKKSRID